MSQLSKKAKQRQLAGSRKGSAIVEEAFAAALTRRRFCELVGIHGKTLTKWERAGVLEPATAVILNSPTRVFSADDVEFGQALIAFLHRHPGRYSVAEAAEVVRETKDGKA
jgi:DNA-binding transcriptional MerR regulator